MRRMVLPAQAGEDAGNQVRPCSGCNHDRIHNGPGEGKGYREIIFTFGRIAIKVCAVTPAYNCREPLARLLEVLLRQTRPLDEIIVVDNASTDGTKEMIEERFPADLTYVRLPENLGGAAGFDHGMRLAHQHGHEWIWCLDSDALPGEDTLDELFSASYESLAPVVARTCLLQDPVSGRTYPGGWFQDPKRPGRKTPFEKSKWEGNILPVDFGTLCCLLVSAEAVRHAGFVRNDLFIYFDETFLSHALKAVGEIIQVGTVIVSHPQSEHRLEMRRGRLRWAVREYWRTYYLFRNEFLFEKYYSGVRRVWGKFIYTYLHRLGGILIHDDNKAYRMEILTRAFCDGLLGRTGKRIDPQEFQRRCKHQTAVC